MYVCICNAFTDKAVKDSIAKRPCASWKEIYNDCAKGEKPQCGKCVDTIKALQATLPCAGAK